MIYIVILWMLLIMDATPWWCFALWGAEVAREVIKLIKLLKKE